MANQKNRIQLQNLFKSGAQPSEADFKDLIDGVLNISDDGIEKPAGADTPLKISTYGEQENVLDIYAGSTSTWRLNQKPTADTQGLNLETGGSSKLFIDSSTGNLGLGITKPIAKLHIQQTGSQNALRIDDEVGDTTPLIVDAEGNVGIGTDKPNTRLDVNGDTAIAGALSVTKTLSVTETSTLTGNVGIGTAPTNSEKLKVNGNIAIAGSLSITQTSTLTGNVGIGTAPANSEKLKVNGNTAIAGNLTVSGGITNAEVLQVTAVDRTDHVNTDGAIYRKGGQVYLTVDDNFYIRDSNSASDAIAAHFNTNSNGGLNVYGTGKSSFAGSLSITQNLSVEGKFKVKLDLIRCGGRSNWTTRNHPVSTYFRNNLKGEPVGTTLMAISDKPGWEKIVWQGYVDHTGSIWVSHLNWSNANPNIVGP